MLSFSGLISEETGLTIGLAIFLTLILVWFVTENFLLEKYLRSIFTVHPVFILVISGVVHNLRESESEKNILFSWVILIISILLFLNRVVLTVYRYHQRKAIPGYKTII